MAQVTEKLVSVQDAYRVFIDELDSNVAPTQSPSLYVRCGIIHNYKTWSKGEKYRPIPIWDFVRLVKRYTYFHGLTGSESPGEDALDWVNSVFSEYLENRDETYSVLPPKDQPPPDRPTDVDDVWVWEFIESPYGVYCEHRENDEPSIDELEAGFLAAYDKAQYIMGDKLTTAALRLAKNHPIQLPAGCRRRRESYRLFLSYALQLHFLSHHSKGFMLPVETTATVLRIHKDTVSEYIRQARKAGLIRMTAEAVAPFGRRGSARFFEFIDPHSLQAATEPIQLSERREPARKTRPEPKPSLTVVSGKVTPAKTATAFLEDPSQCDGIDGASDLAGLPKTSCRGVFSRAFMGMENSRSKQVSERLSQWSTPGDALKDSTLWAYIRHELEGEK